MHNDIYLSDTKGSLIIILHFVVEANVGIGFDKLSLEPPTSMRD